MPSLQLDVPAAYDAATTRELARRLGAVYAEVMGARADLVTVVVREASVWRCTDGEPEPGALLMCDVRRGRSAEVRSAALRGARRGVRRGRRRGPWHG